MVKIGKDALIRTISFTLAAFLVLAGYLIRTDSEKSSLIREARHSSERDLEDLTASLNNISVSLEKATVSSDAAELCSLAAELWRESGTAKKALASLPQSETELTAINRLLSQAGDYSLYLAHRLISGENISSEEREKLLALSKTASSVAASVSDAAALYGDGALEAEIISAFDADYISTFGESLSEIEDTVTDYPTLIYDGPYSDHLLTEKPRALEGMSKISAAEAKIIASEISGMAKNELPEPTVSEGEVRCYCFTGDSFDIEITETGGMTADYRKFRTVGNEKLSPDDAVSIAKEYLGRGNEEFVPTYYFTDEGVCTVNFAYTDGFAVYYTDLVKIGIALDTGETVMIEASGYIHNHHIREKPSPMHSEDEARAKLTSGLSVKSSRLSVIPTSGGKEKLCWEFTCTGGAHETLVYIDTETLCEDDILIVLAADGGTLVK